MAQPLSLPSVPAPSWLWGHHGEFVADPLGFVERYSRLGDVVPTRFGPLGFWLVHDPQLIGEILTTKGSSFGKDAGLRRIRVILGDGLLTSEGRQHERNSRMMQPAFRAKAVESYAAAMVETTEEVADGWAEGGEIELASELSRLALRIVARALFGADVRDAAAAVESAMTEALPLLDDRMNAVLPLPLWIPTAANRRFARARQVLDGVVYRMIEERRRAPAGTDLLSHLLAAREEGKGLTDQELRDEVMTLFLAGHETTANAMAFTLWLLAKNPDARAKVQAEVGSVLGQRRAVAEDAHRLAWTAAAVHEAMRLYPPAWFLGRQATENVELGGGRLRVPKHTVMAMSPLIVQRDPRWWDEPMAFRPERFLPGAPRPAAFTYFPFGGGKRACIGRSFALLEATLVVATLVQRVDLEMDTTREIEVKPHLTLRPAAIPAIVHRRQAAQLEATTTAFDDAVSGAHLASACPMAEKPPRAPGAIPA
jgi:cytochrome P450